MSRAFTKETAESAPPPERMIDEGPNLVTPEGLAQIDAHIARLESAMATEANVLLRETLARDLRYWTVRKATAEVVPPIVGDGRGGDDGKGGGDTVAFGSTVTIRRKGREQTFRIVGVDQADPARGLISFRSPMAQAVLGAKAGEVIEAGDPLGEIEVTRL
jgi:transcription elongation GreA/GreB family factor